MKKMDYMKNKLGRQRRHSIVVARQGKPVHEIICLIWDLLNAENFATTPQIFLNESILMLSQDS